MNSCKLEKSLIYAQSKLFMQFMKDTGFQHGLQSKITHSFHTP